MAFFSKNEVTLAVGGLNNVIFDRNGNKRLSFTRQILYNSMVTGSTLGTSFDTHGLCIKILHLDKVVSF